MQREGTECYRIFIRGLLDLTDNVVGRRGRATGTHVVRYDPDDPYLVVAADKGTATFSDTANALAAEYGFWLGDAFASGGSAGYDHKKMGITARGGWECVKRHFRELGLDTQSQALHGRRHRRHGGRRVRQRHAPVEAHPAAGRLQPPAHLPRSRPGRGAQLQRAGAALQLPRSSWADYDTARDLEGRRRVPARRQGDRALNSQARALLGDRRGEGQRRPTSSARSCKLPVDLLWNGGIGTYVKASWEANSAVGDRTNDAVRVDGRELRCRVVGEGGNLGFSQLGRIEYALRGGRINTDFVDNSGGVDCSDHEVNIKILLKTVQREDAARDAASATGCSRR